MGGGDQAGPSSQRAGRLLHTSDRLPWLRRDGPLPAQGAGRVRDRRWPWGAYLGEDGIKHGIRAKVSTIRSLDANSITPAAKACGQYLNSSLAKVEVTDAGYDEAVMLNSRGFVTQGPANIFWVRNGFSPRRRCRGLLEGITRDTVMQMAAKLDIPVREADTTRSDLHLADEAFFTGTAAEVVPIRELATTSSAAASRGR